MSAPATAHGLGWPQADGVASAGLGWAELAPDDTRNVPIADTEADA
jgi:hypothetical protein